MSNQKNRYQFIFAAITALVFFSSTSLAVDLIGSGYSEFSEVDGGETKCRIKNAEAPCEMPLDWLIDYNCWTAKLPVPGFTPIGTFFIDSRIETQSNPNNKVVGAAFSNMGLTNWTGKVQAGWPFYATSWLYKDIEIEDPSNNNNPVDVQISPTITWEGGIAGNSNYEGRISLSIEVEDITDSSAPVQIGSYDLVNRDRSGDQTIIGVSGGTGGVDISTDVAGGASSYDRNDDTSHFSVKLLRGNTYRIYFKAEAYGAPLMSGIESSIRSRLEKIAFTVDYDISEQLAEIKRLLLTPQGRRDGFPLKDDAISARQGAGVSVQNNSKSQGAKK